MIKLFVYGTLRKGGSNHALIEPYLHASQPYQIHGRLYDVGGEYPVLVWDPAEPALVRGELLTVSEQALGPIDRLEGYYGPGHPDNEYERVLHPAGFYLYTWSQQAVDQHRLRRIEQGDWLQYLRSKQA